MPGTTASPPTATAAISGVALLRRRERTVGALLPVALGEVALEVGVAGVPCALVGLAPPGPQLELVGRRVGAALAGVGLVAKQEDRLEVVEHALPEPDRPMAVHGVRRLV